MASLLTGCGFTTKESEIILSSPSRRKLARAIMLFGYVFSVSIVSAVVNIVLSLRQSEIEKLFWELPVLLALLVALALLKRIPKVRRFSEKLFSRLAERIFYRKKGENRLLLLDYISSSAIAQIDLFTTPTELLNVPLRNSGLRQENILIMLLRRSGKDARPMSPDECFLDGDTLVVCGPLKSIEKRFHAGESLEEEGEA